ncbi:MAG: class I SAM-dependent methyltransferase, partial [Candidatus Acidiferrales bacterium]
LGASARQWVGVDFLAAYLRDARARRRLAPGTTLAAAQAGQLPFADAAFDVVIRAQNTLGLLGEQKLPTVQEAVRVTRPGGRALFVLYSEFSLVPRAEWYMQMHRRGLMAILDWSRSTLELMVTEDGHASGCFRRRSLEELFRAAGLTPRIQRLGDIYWVVQVQRNSSQEGTGQ